MQILILSKADRRGGGASAVACDLRESLENLSETCTHLGVFQPQLEDQPFLYASKRIPHRIISRLAWVSQGVGLQELIPWEWPRLSKMCQDFDLVHVHDTTRAISPYTLRRLAENKPVVWTMHDCSPFTGGCLGGFDDTIFCPRLSKGCGSCPNQGNWPLKGVFDFTDQVLKAKQRLWPNIKFVAPSQWMADKASAHSGIRDIAVIPNGVDLAKFKPLNKEKIRAELGIPVNAKVFIWIAGHFKDPIKGGDEFLEVMSQFKEQAFPIIVGRIEDQDKQLIEEKFGKNALIAGYLQNKTELAKYLNASDAFVYPTRLDNFPLVVLEALACGIPVFSYKTGGVPEMVTTEVGTCVAQGDVQGLIRAIIARNENLAEMGIAARKRAETHYGLELFGTRHRTLYERLIHD